MTVNNSPSKELPPPDSIYVSYEFFNKLNRETLIEAVQNKFLFPHQFNKIALITYRVNSHYLVLLIDRWQVQKSKATTEPDFFKIRDDISSLRHCFISTGNFSVKRSYIGGRYVSYLPGTSKEVLNWSHASQFLIKEDEEPQNISTESSPSAENYIFNPDPKQENPAEDPESLQQSQPLTDKAPALPELNSELTPEYIPPSKAFWFRKMQTSDTEFTRGICNGNECRATLKANLEAVGIDSDRSQTLSAFLYACYLNNQPVLLAGSAGLAIAEALSLAVDAEHAVHLSCNGPFDPAALKDLPKDFQGLLCVSAPFTPGWIEPLMLLAEESERMICFIQPFKEDLKVEPADLSEYALPLLTSAFMKSRRKDALLQTDFALDFEHATAYTGPLPHKEAFEDMGLSPLSVTELGDVIVTAEELLTGEELDEELEFLCGLLPVAYMTGHTDILAAELDRASLEDSLAKLIKRLGGIPS